MRTKANESSYYLVINWMITKLNLRGCDLAFFAVVYSIVQRQDSSFFFNFDYMSSMTGYETADIEDSFNKLCGVRVPGSQKLLFFNIYGNDDEVALSLNRRQFGKLMYGDEYDHEKEMNDWLNSNYENVKISESPKGNVYVMIDTSNNFYKIGYTKNEPKYRERTLQSEKPTIELLLCFNGTRKDEIALHEKFKNFRIRGEWFDLSPEDIIEIKEYFKTKIN